MNNTEIMLLYTYLNGFVKFKQNEEVTTNILVMFSYIYKLNTASQDQAGNIINDANKEYLSYVNDNKAIFSIFSNKVVTSICERVIKYQIENNCLENNGKLQTALEELEIKSKIKEDTDYSPIIGKLELKDTSNYSFADIIEAGSKFKGLVNVEELDVKFDDTNTLEFLKEILEEELEYDMRVIKELYSSGYESFTPDGIIYKRGMVAIEGLNDGTGRYKLSEVQNPALSRLYSWLNKVLNNRFDLRQYDGHMKPSYENIIEKGIVYYPHYQARNSCGLKGLDSTLDKWLSGKKSGRLNNMKDLSVFLHDKLLNTLLDAVKKNTRINLSEDSDLANDPELRKMLLEFRKAFTCGVIITESKKNVVLKVKICTGDSTIEHISKELIENAIANNELFTRATKVSYFNIINDVLTITFMMDENQYNNFPLFAYQVVEAIRRNGKPDWSNVIVGKTMNDQIFRLNLKNNMNRIIAIIAGARSGKGVMTLNLLGNAYSLGYPVFYLDFKPDMALSFYNMARNKGVESFCFDGLHGTVGIPRDYDLVQWMNNLDADVLSSMDRCGISREKFVLFTSYVKGVQLLTNLIKLRASVLNGKDEGLSLEELGGERIVIVLDEFEKLALYGVELLEGKGSKFDECMNNIKLNHPEVKAADLKTFPAIKWLEEYKSWVNSVFSTLQSQEKAEIGLARCNIFILAQSTEIDAKWGEIIGSKISTLIKNGIMMCGNGSNSGSGSQKYGCSACSPEWKAALANRYFIIQKTAGSGVDNTNSELVKGYFLLNEVYESDGETESRFVTDMFSNLGAQADAVRTKITGADGKLNEAIGFEGYMRALSDISIAEVFQVSWDVGQRVAQKIYKRENLLDFMYDVSDMNYGLSVVEYLNEAEVEELKNGSKDSGNSSVQTDAIANLTDPEADVKYNFDDTIEVEDEAKDKDKNTEETVSRMNFGNLNTTSSPIDIFRQIDKEYTEESYEEAADEEEIEFDLDYDEADNTKVQGDEAGYNEVQGDEAEKETSDYVETDEFDGDMDIDFGTLNELDERTQAYEQIQKGIEEDDSERDRVQEVIEAVNSSNTEKKEKFNKEDYETAIRVLTARNQAEFKTNPKHGKATTVPLEKIKTQKMGINKDNGVDARNVGLGAIYKRENFLSKTKFGAKLYKKDVFSGILDTIRTTFGTDKVIGKVVMKEEQMLVNDKYIYLNGVTGGSTGRNLSDLVIFSLLAKNFNRMTYLYIDEPFYDAMCMEYNMDPVNAQGVAEKMFGLFPILSELNICDNSIKKADIHRANMDRKELERQKRMQERISENINRQQFDAELQTMTNTRPNKDMSMALRSVYKSNEYLTKAEKHLLNGGSPVKGIGYGVATIGALGFAAVSGITRGVTKGIRSIFRTK